MIGLIAAVFVASLVGSLHCAGMCGAFVALAVGRSAARSGPLGGWAHLAYHAGRLATYVILGAAAGAVGAAFDLGGALIGVQRAALAVAGAAMVVFGIAGLARRAGARLAWLDPPARLGGAYAAIARRAAELPPAGRALGIGLASTFLPCGWLWAFVVTAAGTGSAALGALAMAVFWTGTLPVMVALGVGVRALAGPLRRHAPAVGAAALVVVGLVAVAGRARIAPPPPPHIAGARAANGQSTVDAAAGSFATLEHAGACGESTGP
jgi:sulfite exporter TauE/SafE